MTLTRALALVALAVGGLLSTPGPGLACDCHDGGPVCEAFWKTPVVFVGRVESVEAVRPPHEGWARERVRFRVTEALRGTTTKFVDIVNGHTSCHHRFTPGEPWVVYALAQEQGGALTTHTCTRTAPLAQAAEDVAYGRASHARTALRGRIFGTVRYWRTDGDVAVPRVRITLQRDDGGSLSVLTDAQGRYDILAPAGRYRLRARLPRGMTTAAGERAVELADTRGCARADVSVDYPGRVAGRVVDASGSPIPHLSVELVRADGYEFPPSRLRAVTDAAGRYTIAGVRPGRYAPAVVIGRTDSRTGTEPVYLFTGGATTQRAVPWTDVGGGTRRDAGVLVLPRPTAIVQVTGTVVRPNGRPAGGVTVRAKAAAGEAFPWTTLRTDARGSFSFALVRALPYRLVAERGDGIGTGSAALTLDPSSVPSPLRLTLPEQPR